jgi:hypothetical protein
MSVEVDDDEELEEELKKERVEIITRNQVFKLKV